MSTALDKHATTYQDSFKYALDNRLILNWYPERILKRSRGDSILELGLGHGYTTKNFSKVFDRHVVIEGSPEVISQFNTKFPDCDAEIRNCFFEDFESDEKFDNVVMGFVLEHVMDPLLILKKFRSFVKPKGRIFVAVPNAEALNKRFGYEAGILDDMFKLSPADLESGHHRLFSVNTLRELIHEAGYSEFSLEGIFLKPITTAQIKQLCLPEEILQAMLKVGVDYPELCVAMLMELKLT